jgi:hypothetical protein
MKEVPLIIYTNCGYFLLKKIQIQQEMFSTTLLETSTCIPPLWWKLQLSIASY